MPVEADEAQVYQLRAVICGVSPLIWRRLLVPGDTTIAGLHSILQTVFGWGDDYLHRFTIHGVEYGISYAGGLGFRHDAHAVHLADLGLRKTERFSYEYNLFAFWDVALRVEDIVPVAPGKTYPRCVAGRRAGPPQQWRGPAEFTERTEPYRVFEATVRAAEIVQKLLDTDANANSLVYEHEGEMRELLPLLGLERFDRRACNEVLAASITSIPASEERPV